MDEIKEKIYCCEKDNSAMLAALMNSKDNPAELMAMMNNNNWNNSPWMYLIFLALFGDGFGWGRRGNGVDAAQNADLSRQIATLQDSVSTNHANDIALDAINGNTSAIRELSTMMNTDFNTLSTAICNVKSAIEQVGGQVGYSAESIKNAISLGDSNIMSKMQDCCCQTKTAILEQGYQNQLATERQTNVLGSQIADFRAADQLQTCQQTNALNTSINDVRQAVVNGFANVGYQNSQNTAQIIQNATANTQRILDTLCQNTQQELRDKLAQMSQEAQTQTIINQLSKQCGCGCNC